VTIAFRQIIKQGAHSVWRIIVRIQFRIFSLYVSYFETGTKQRAENYKWTVAVDVRRTDNESIAVREDERLSQLKKRTLRITSGRKGEEVTDDWKEKHNLDLH
jgi:hypothetical protein